MSEPIEDEREALTRAVDSAECETDECMGECVVEAVFAAGFRRQEPRPVTDAEVKAALSAPRVWPNGYDMNVWDAMRAALEAARGVEE